MCTIKVCVHPSGYLTLKHASDWAQDFVFSISKTNIRTLTTINSYSTSVFSFIFQSMDNYVTARSLMSEKQLHILVEDFMYNKFKKFRKYYYLYFFKFRYTNFVDYTM